MSTPSMTLDAAVRRAIRRAPSTIRALARAAGVSHELLAGILAGRRRATPAVAQKIAQVLDRWAARCTRDAAAVRTAIAGRTGKGRP